MEESLLLVAAVVLALLLDYLFAEPRKFHPLVGFGFLANRVEHRLNIRHASKSLGVLAWCLVVVPLLLIFYCMDKFFSVNPWLHVIFSALILYLSIGWQSLLQHARAVAIPLQNGDMKKARAAVAMIVSRDTDQLESVEVAKAATESVLENGADAVFCALFWFLLAGVPGVVLYRLSNTLDAMWGYKNDRFLQFGYCAARIDDLLNFIPARLTALSYALCGNTAMALRCWREQSAEWKSPNAGPVMSAGAGALLVSLGGRARYHQQSQWRPVLGLADQPPYQPAAQTIHSACYLINKSVLLWLFVTIIFAVASIAINIDRAVL